MTRILVVAYFFPPKGGAGTQRFAKFCKYLPGFGFEPVVLTVADHVRSTAAPVDDPTLLANPALQVTRVQKPMAPTFAQRTRRTLRWTLDEDEWADAATLPALDLVRSAAPQAVVTTLSPYACYRIGLRLKRELGLPWILDLRDPWALDGWRSYRTPLHAWHDLGHMRLALAHADFVIANVPEAARRYRELGAAPGRVVTIPNGFDEGDFPATSPPRPAGDARFRLVHAGTLQSVDQPAELTRNGLFQRRHCQITPRGRTGYYLLQAIALLKERAPATYRHLSVQLIGSVDPTHVDMIERLGLSDGVAVHGYRSHRESVAALCSTDALFVPLHDVAPGERALVVPGKVYESLASERPLLAALPPGDGADLIRHLQAGLVVPPTDALALSNALGTLVERHRRGEVLAGCRRTSLWPLTRRHLTSLLAEVLRAAVERRAQVGIQDPWQALGVPSAAAS